MKKKMMFYICTSIFITLLLVTVLFISIANLQHESYVKKQLRNNNFLVRDMLETNNIRDKHTFFNINYKRDYIRITYIDKYGNILYDSKVNNKNLKNHKHRKEIEIASKNNEGIDLRFSETTGEKSIYLATKLKNGYFLRSSMPFDPILGFNQYYFKYYFIVIIIVFLITIIFSNRLSYIIIKPIKDLDFITSRIAKGELDRRVSLTSKDEIGQLAKSFNQMADKLQENINDSIDKQNRLEAILRSMDSGIIAIDRAFKIIMINPYAQKIFGVSNNVMGKGILEEINNCDLEKVFRNNNDEYCEMKILSDKEKILRVKTADIINRSEHIGRVAVVQDITDIKKLENMRSEFVANVSHELKTPLTSIRGFAETLKEVEDQNTREKFLNIINDEAVRLTRLISDILTLSDIEQVKEIKEENLDVNKIIKEICNLMKNIADDKGIEINEVYEDIPMVYGSIDRFKQMIINLIDNAIKYSEPGAKIYIKTQKFQGNIKISVKDTGVGIPKEHIPRLFERFYRVDKARSRSKGGTGLGLAIVKHIVLSMNGNIEVQSIVKKGSKFIVTIPYC